MMLYLNDTPIRATNCIVRDNNILAVMLDPRKGLVWIYPEFYAA